MTHKSEKLNTAFSLIPEGQNPTAQTKRTDFAPTHAPHLQTDELTQKEIAQIIREKSQIEGKNEGFKSLHR
jgi:hypothetical protein